MWEVQFLSKTFKQFTMWNAKHAKRHVLWKSALKNWSSFRKSLEMVNPSWQVCFVEMFSFGHLIKMDCQCSFLTHVLICWLWNVSKNSFDEIEWINAIMHMITIAFDVITQTLNICIIVFFGFDDTCFSKCVLKLSWWMGKLTCVQNCSKHNIEDLFMNVHNPNVSDLFGFNSNVMAAIAGLSAFHVTGCTTKSTQEEWSKMHQNMAETSHKALDEEMDSDAFSKCK